MKSLPGAWPSPWRWWRWEEPRESRQACASASRFERAVVLPREEIEVRLQPKEGYAARAGKGVVLVLETSLTQDLIEEWWARELVAAVNGIRGDRSLPYEARIHLHVWCGPNLRRALEKNLAYLNAETLSTDVTFHSLEESGGVLKGSAGNEAYR